MTFGCKPRMPVRLHVLHIQDRPKDLGGSSSYCCPEAATKVCIGYEDGIRTHVGIA